MSIDGSYKFIIIIMHTSYRLYCNIKGAKNTIVFYVSITNVNSFHNIVSGNKIRYYNFQ